MDARTWNRLHVGRQDGLVSSLVDPLRSVTRVRCSAAPVREQPTDINRVCHAAMSEGRGSSLSSLRSKSRSASPAPRLRQESSQAEHERAAQEATRDMKETLFSHITQLRGWGTSDEVNTACFLDVMRMHFNEQTLDGWAAIRGVDNLKQILLKTNLTIAEMKHMCTGSTQLVQAVHDFDPEKGFTVSLKNHGNRQFVVKAGSKHLTGFEEQAEKAKAEWLMRTRRPQFDEPEVLLSEIPLFGQMPPPEGLRSRLRLSACCGLDGAEGEFCRKCGRPWKPLRMGGSRAEDLLSCPHCKANVTIDANYCQKCGGDLRSEKGASHSLSPLKFDPWGPPDPGSEKIALGQWRESLPEDARGIVADWSSSDIHDFRNKKFLPLGKFRLQSETFGWRLKGTSKGSGIHPIVDCTQLLAAVKNVEIIYCHEFNNAAKGFFDRVYAKYQPLVDMAPAKALDFLASYERTVRYACGRLGSAHFGTQELFAVESLATANTAMLLQEQIKYELRQSSSDSDGDRPGGKVAQRVKKERSQQPQGRRRRRDRSRSKGRTSERGGGRSSSPSARSACIKKSLCIDFNTQGCAKQDGHEIARRNGSKFNVGHKCVKCGDTQHGAQACH